MFIHKHCPLDNELDNRKYFYYMIWFLLNLFQIHGFFFLPLYFSGYVWQNFMVWSYNDDTARFKKEEAGVLSFTEQ